MLLFYYYSNKKFQHLSGDAFKVCCDDEEEEK